MNNLKFLLVPSLSGSVQTWRTQSRVTLHSTPPNFFSGEMVLIFIKLTLHFKSACLPKSNSLSSQSEIRPVLMLLPVAEENFQKCWCVAYSEICRTNCISLCHCTHPFLCHLQCEPWGISRDFISKAGWLTSPFHNLGHWTAV